VVDLVDCANRLAGELSYGQQRRLEIARAMCTRPQIICLDEPAAGLNPQETEALSAMIRLLRDEHDLTVVLIEHDMGMVMSIPITSWCWTTASSLPRAVLKRFATTRK
jgi:branched-chain amino acid transport system ATP-binding protein